MRLTLQLLGLELDISFGPTPTDIEYDDHDPGRDLGTTGGYFVGFAQHVAPEEIPAPQHCPSWDEPEDEQR